MIITLEPFFRQWSSLQSPSRTTRSPNIFKDAEPLIQKE